MTLAPPFIFTSTTSSSTTMPRPVTSITDCSICKQLNEIEVAGQKCGRPEDDTFLPAASDQLKTVAGSTLKRCPECGTHYDYRTSYNWYVNGGEDDQELLRLTPADVRDRMSAAEYARRIAHLKKELESRRKAARGYAAKSLLFHYVLEEKDLDPARGILTSDDEVIRDTSFRYLFRLSECYESGKSLAPFKPLLKSLATSPSEKIREHVEWIRQNARWTF